MAYARKILPGLPTVSIRWAVLLTGLLTLPTMAMADEAADPNQPHKPRYDYPTSARADYVIGCLASNGMKHEFLDKCSCGIDTIADQMSYDDYQHAETVLSMLQGALGQRAEEFRSTAILTKLVDRLRQAQAEANLRCH
ncbi:hypothetical protein [Granulibacter bethesdensis]|uniref:Secreted protein n=1 Tax=Granulibacter bethesdensis (strain ATCC BAA-1260 / CGDNIH1) TaxID=391165 RepID=Q0BQS9_GRABC|nr:hypothetical protein [Granulibacter bethesdensis]ABI62823.1 putative secreted protein [Granulibacter bethesdensis CGDNIH1]AHJ68225.1 putative secreted protein [Granulibacter bethesdensis]APH52687.1 putative secreted protein [Granulibacter bethesdensis]APH60262.1 putative secreted protein [Granulibacter bethesdensis]APH65377.1 putative secreted protein [Granulibacter bethesdensis]